MSDPASGAGQASAAPGPSGGQRPPQSQDPHRARRTIGRAIAWGAPLLALYSAAAVFLSITRHPRTDDASVRANVVGVSANVSGYVVEVAVVDNQPVKQGDLLFIIDRRPFELAVLDAESKIKLVDLQIKEYEDGIVSARSAVVEAEAKLLYAEQYLARIEPLLAKQFVTPNDVDMAKRDVRALKALVDERIAQLKSAENALGQVGDVNVRRTAALAALEKAELELAYCSVRSPVDGYVTNMNISPGTYLKAGDLLFTVVDGSQWFVMANFQETVLRRIRPGMKTKVYLMAYPNSPVEGVVQGIGWALNMPYEVDQNGLPTTQPMLDWVRLAQRFPVRVTLPPANEGQPYRMGATATVIVFMDKTSTIPPWVERILPDWFYGLPLMPDRPPDLSDL
jgi:multidrug efflux system membrane fusion protein